MMDYQQAIDYLASLSKFGIKLGLERINALSRAFGNPQHLLRTIHVGGTNGKGSTATFIASILREAGYQTGLYLSPYVHDLRERVQINGAMIPKEDFAEIVGEIKPIADDMAASELGEVTEFELKTMVALLYFARQKVDFAVIEVGMGGRFDATNIVEPYVSVITNVGLDHMERLGDTVEKIAFEKAGIIKTGSIVVTATTNEDAWRVIVEKCRQTGAEVWRVVDAKKPPKSSRTADFQVRYRVTGDKFSVKGGEINMIGLKPGLHGDFQHANAATAVSAILALRKYEKRVTDEAVHAGVANAYLPGRFEIIADRPTVIIDGAHNHDAAKSLAKSLAGYLKKSRMALVIGMLENHDPDTVLSVLAPLSTRVYATSPKWIKASTAETVAKSARKFTSNVYTIPDVNEALIKAMDSCEEDDVVLVTGSFYTIGEVRPIS